jgi:hypothetical protein
MHIPKQYSNTLSVSMKILYVLHHSGSQLTAKHIAESIAKLEGRATEIQLSITYVSVQARMSELVKSNLILKSKDNKGIYIYQRTK